MERVRQRETKVYTMNLNLRNQQRSTKTKRVSETVDNKY